MQDPVPACLATKAAAARILVADTGWIAVARKEIPASGPQCQPQEQVPFSSGLPSMFRHWRRARFDSAKTEREGQGTLGHGDETRQQRECLAARGRRE